jgi:hypothetical protein
MDEVSRMLVRFGIRIVATHWMRAGSEMPPGVASELLMAVIVCVIDV